MYESILYTLEPPLDRCRSAVNVTRIVVIEAGLESKSPRCRDIILHALWHPERGGDSLPSHTFNVCPGDIHPC